VQGRNSTRLWTAFPSHLVIRSRSLLYAAQPEEVSFGRCVLLAIHFLSFVGAGLASFCGFLISPVVGVRALGIIAWAGLDGETGWSCSCTWDETAYERATQGEGIAKSKRFLWHARS